MWPCRLSCDQSRDLLAWSRDLPGLVTWPQYNWSRDQALAIEYLACAFFIIKLKVEGNLKCGYNAQYHFQCKVAINLGSFESFILLCSWSQWRRSRGWTCNDHLRPRFDQYRYYFENLLEWTFGTLNESQLQKKCPPVSKSLKFYHVKPRFEILHQYRCYFAHSLDWTFRTIITRKLLQNYAPVNTLVGYKLTFWWLPRGWGYHLKLRFGMLHQWRCYFLDSL